MKTHNSCLRRLGHVLPLFLAVSLWPWAGFGAAVKAFRSEIDIPTYPWWPAVKHPYFRGTDKVNVYPYPMLDNLSRKKETRRYRTVVLENEYLRVTFLPELGGKVHEVLDKVTGEQMFYLNEVVKPGLIGQCGAWTSGGIEWNTGPQGHTVSCMQPVDVEILPPARDGSRSVAVGEVERIYRTRWTVLVTLRPGRAFLEETVRIYNRTETIRPYYFWNCTAVPNPPGFRFIYPMTLGSDHGAEKFFSWPIDDGKDLTRGTNYQDASSIFAWHCDQDFFGSYDDGADRGVVAFANHHQLPGKKAWTWGQGGFGKMHQMDLTDSSGPYNEVQTGPLLTQADVGRLEPLEAVSWREWWYPVRGIGGFTFANQDLAANTAVTNGQLHLRVLGTGSWDPVKVSIRKDQRTLSLKPGKISPRQPSEWRVPLEGITEPFEVQIDAGDDTLARFRVPLDLPVRKPPTKPAPPSSAEAFTRAGWEDFLFAKWPEAEKQFQRALAQDSNAPAAHVGLAFIAVDRNPALALEHAEVAVKVDPDCGPAQYARAIALVARQQPKLALDAAWKAALDPQLSIPARALIAKLHLRQSEASSAISALEAPGPWEADPVCRNRLAVAQLKHGSKARAIELAHANLELDPLDSLARAVLWLARAEGRALPLGNLVQDQPEPLLELIADLVDLGQYPEAQQILQSFQRDRLDKPQDARLWYWGAWLAHQTGAELTAREWLARVGTLSVEGVFPYHPEMLPALEWARRTNPEDGKATLLLGHLLFALGRHEPGQQLWREAAERKVAPAIAYRALGMAALNLNTNRTQAAELLEQAHQLDRTDPIVARDLARVRFAMADAADGEQRRALWRQIVAALDPAFAAGKGRSDFVALLARAHNRLGEYGATARMLDQVRVTVWEGAREVHDLFEEAHLELGKEQLAAGRHAAALAEFNRALEYPENLATGKLEHTREAHIHYLRGQALVGMGERDAAIRAYTQAANEPASKNPRQQTAREQAQAALAKLQNQ